MNNLKEIIRNLDIGDITISPSEYTIWARQFGDDGIEAEDKTGNRTISATEIRDVIEEAIKRQTNEDDGAEIVEAEHLLTTLTDNGFCQALEVHIDPLVDIVWNRQKKLDDVAFKML